jgi:ABC-type enterobactin transport system permease subunit
MKNSQILVLFLIGAVLTVIGALFKITNERKDWTSFFLIIGMTFEAVAGILLILKLFKKNKNNSESFLDS